jgi:predicted XRE-type DNA-binding protein
MGDPLEIEMGSGNVFAYLGFPNPDEHLAKAGLALAISQRITELGLTQTQAAKLIGVAQPRISAVVRGHLRAVSLERLAGYLGDLGVDIEMIPTKAPPDRQRGTLTVRAG